MKLLIENANEQDIETFCEQSENGKQYFIEGIWATANQPNKNKRVYPGEIMEAAIGLYDKEYIQDNRAVGELNHPASPTVNCDRICHKIASLKLEGDFVYGKAKVTDSPHLPMGLIVRGLIDEGIKLGVSTRGLGELISRPDGFNQVNKGFSIKAIDVVHDPSGPGCWVKPVMEDVEYEMLADGTIIEMVVDMHKKPQNEEKIFAAMQAFIQRWRGE